MEVTRWRFDIGGTYDYTFPRNPDRYGGDSYWRYEPRMTELDVIGASVPSIQVDGFRGARRTLRFTAVTGTMMRTLQNFFLRKQIVNNCRDHLYPTTPQFGCFVAAFVAAVRPTIGTFPSSGEDTYDVEMTLIRMG